ncbi:extracellular solute-binding protein [Candidatus Poriferisodalis sp.]|uniref:extracellular solute-binding protein n=1 Tax=Candidatus Poriferisodalis sp. TaxID=3101277 RepID=UPI003B02089B
MIASACGSVRTLEGPAAAIYNGDCAEADHRRLTVYSGRTENLIQPVLDAFECETGVDVAVRWGASNDLALLLAEEGDRTSADVFLSRSPGPVGFLESKGLLGAVNADVAGLVNGENRSAALTWVGFTGRKRVLVYNADNVVADELPASVFDLTDERYRGRVAIPATNGSFVDWFTVFRHQHGDDAVTQWLGDMVANDARYYPNNRSIVEAAGRGEIDMGLVNHYYQYQVAEAIGDGHRAANWEFTGDDIGSLLIITAATVTAASEHTVAANEFIAYLLSAPAQQYFSSETLEYPLAAGVAPADVLPSLEGPEVGSLSFDSLGEGFARSTEIIEASGILNE